jgi:squalene synthase HpnC
MDSGHLGKAFHGAEHYENFPVASWLIPVRARAGLLALYRFARAGDDLADEPGLEFADRIAGLAALRNGLLNPSDPPSSSALSLFNQLGAALAGELRVANLPTQPAENLLKAFEQDVSHQPMHSPDQVLDYCSRSANPVGRLVLGLAQIESNILADSPLMLLSDAICTGLQLANFAQDLGEDFERGRIYCPSSWIPQLELSRYVGLRLGQRLSLTMPEHYRREIALRMAAWAQVFLEDGEGLAAQLRQHPQGGYRIALEIALTVTGGLAICRQVKQQPGAVWKQSPRLSKSDLALILWPAIRRLF